VYNNPSALIEHSWLVECLYAFLLQQSLYYKLLLLQNQNKCATGFPISC